MPRPVNLVDTVHDFGPNNDISLSFTINTSTFSEAYSILTPTQWNSTPGASLSIRNFHSINSGVISGDVNNTPASDFIDVNGIKIPPSNNFGVLTYNLVLTAPSSNYSVSPTQTEVTLLNTRPSSNINFKTGNIALPGSYLNTHYFYLRFPDGFLPGFTSWNKYQTVRYYYNIFQKSVAIIENVTGLPVVVNTQTLSNVNLNDKIRVSKAKSRGKEVGSAWVVQVRDSGGNFINAVQGVDYNITFGTLGADTLEIEILQAKLYKVICNVSGYTSINNNFYSQGGTGDVTVNTDSTFYLIDATSVVNTQDIITLPKIIGNVTIQNQTTTVPVQTGYAGTSITINGELDITTGTYIIKNLITQTDTVVTLNYVQWLQEMNTRTRMLVEIKNKTSGAIILTKDGLGPHENITLPEGNYIIQYKTILK